MAFSSKYSIIMIIIVITINLAAILTPTFLSRLRSSPNLSQSSPPGSVSAVPSVHAHQESRTALITMGFFALACLALAFWTSIRRESRNSGKSAARECHHIVNIVKTLLCNQINFANACLQRHPHPLPIYRGNWFGPSRYQRLAHEPKDLRH